MKLKMLRTPSKKLGCELSEGQVGDVPKELAETLIANRIAEPADAGKTVKTVAKNTDIGGNEKTKNDKETK